MTDTGASNSSAVTSEQEASASPHAAAPAAPSASRRSSRSPCADFRLPLHALLLLFYILSAAYFFLLADRPLVSQGVYIDEHALLVGSATTLLPDDAAAQERIRLTEERSRRSASAREWLHAELSSLPVSVADFTYEHEASELDSLGPTSVVYAIWRAPKGDGKECFVVAAEFDQSSGPLATTGDIGAISGATILITMMRHLAVEKGHEYFHKDVIFVFVGAHRSAEVDQILSSSELVAALRARSVAAFGGWIDAYQSDTASFDRVGSIMVSLMLDVPATSAYSSFSLDVVGFYGLTPNLDAPSVLLRVWDQVGLKLIVSESAVMDAPVLEEEEIITNPVSALLAQVPFLRKSFYSAHTRNEHATSVAVPEWIASLLAAVDVPLRDGRWSTSLSKWKGMWRFMLAALQGGADTAGAFHAHALKYAIDAATIRAVPTKSGERVNKRDQIGIAIKTARCLESSLRSWNNLHEKLHHSTYWYLLNTSSDFATMSKYIYVAVLGIAPITLYALVLLYQMPTSQQRFAHAFAMIAIIYTLCGLAYAGGSIVRHAHGGGRWTDAMTGTWLTLVAIESIAFIFIIMPRLSLLRVVARTLDASEEESRTIELLRDASEDTKHLSSAARAQLASREPRGCELSFSPAHLPLVPVEDLSLSTPAPVFSASLDWRLLHALQCLVATAALVPVMVVNFSACVATLLFLAPIFLTASADVAPTLWFDHFRALRRRDGRPLLNTSRPLEWGKYVVRRILHLAALILCSPVAMLILYAHFHGVTTSAAFRAILGGLAQTKHQNLLYHTCFFVYAPMYVGSCLQLTCAYRVQAGATTSPRPHDQRKHQ